MDISLLYMEKPAKPPDFSALIGVPYRKLTQSGRICCFSKAAPNAPECLINLLYQIPKIKWVAQRFDHFFLLTPGKVAVALMYFVHVFWPLPYRGGLFPN